MWKRLKPERINIEEYHAKITLDMMLEFKRQIKLESYTEEYECNRIKLSDYDMQQFWNWLQKKIISF